MKWFFVSLFLLIAFYIPFPSSIYAKPSTSFSMSGQYIKRSNAVNVYFGNLKGVKSVSYTIMYEGNGIGQGAMGNFAPGKKTAVSKNIYLGTCSGRVCTPHRNIKNIQLEAVMKYINGKSSSKTIKIK